jgi:hypothetical protein
MGYPVMIAAAYSVSSRPLKLVAVAQSLAGGLTCLLAYFLARRAALSPGWSLVAGSLVAIYPPFLFYGSMLLTESVTPFLFTLLVWLMLRTIDTRRWQWAAVVGLTFSVASLVRTNFLPFALVIAFCVWIGVNGRWKVCRHAARRGGRRSSSAARLGMRGQLNADRALVGPQHEWRHEFLHDARRGGERAGTTTRPSDHSATCSSTAACSMPMRRFMTNRITTVKGCA